jgi:hypothetical protein
MQQEAALPMLAGASYCHDSATDCAIVDTPERRMGDLLLSRDLDEVAARVVKDRRGH